MMPRPHPAFAIVLALIPVACSDPAAPGDPTEPDEWLGATWADLGRACPADAPAFSLSEAARDSVPILDHELGTMDALWAGFAREVPGGWGGLFYKDGRLTMYLVDPDQQDEATASLARLFEGSTWAGYAPQLASARILEGRWDFAQLFDWYRYINQYIWEVDGVTFSDIQEAANRIEYGAEDEDALRRATEALAALDLPCFLVALQIRGMPEAAR